MTIFINFGCYYLVNTQLPILWKSSDCGLDSLNCGKWRKISKYCLDLELDQTMPNVRAISIGYNIFKFQAD